MPRKGENIYKRKDGRWEGRYIKDRTPGGKALYGYVYAKSYREVKSKMSCMALPEAKMASETAYRADAGGSILMNAIAKDWLLTIRPQIKESTYVKYRNILNAYILPEMGEVPLSHMTHGYIEAYCSRLLSSGGERGTGLSAKTVTDILNLLRSLLRYASRTGKTPPCDGSSVQIKNTPKEMRVFSRSEQDSLCRYLYDNPGAVNMGILVCLFTGLRVGEICALRWEDVSLSERTIQVRSTMQRIQADNVSGPKTKIIITAPKSACSARTIPIPDELASFLNDLYPSASGYFLTGCEDKFVEPRTMQNHFKRVLKDCGIRSANYHALRHTFATRCVELGFDVKSLSEILGHASVSITMNRYVHPSMELKRNNMQRLSALITVK